MTYNDLKEEIAALGFEENVENSNALLFAVRRALALIFAEFPIYSVIKLYQNPLPVQKEIAKITHKGGECISIDSNAKAYSFKTSGSGTYKVTDSNGERSFDFSNNENRHRGFLIGDATIEFSGDYSYTVYDFWLLTETLGESEEEIPEKDCFTDYKINELTDNFLSFSEMPKNGEGAEIAGAKLINDTVKIPYAYSGKIELTYRSAPILPSGNGDEILNIPNGCAQLLPLLAAAYVWLDDDFEKAQYYMNLYKSGISDLKYSAKRKIDSLYTDVTGWA